MNNWDINADDNVGYTYKYYCKVCEEFFRKSPIASGYCPLCAAPPNYIIGPFKVKEIEYDIYGRKV